MMLVPCRRRSRPFPIRLVSLLSLLSLLPALTGCTLALSGGRRPPRVLHLAAIFPTTGVDGPLGRAVERGVELAVRRHLRLAAGYRLALIHGDEARLSAMRMEAVLRRQHILGIVGLLEGASTLTLLPTIERQRIPTISPGSLLPGPPTSIAGGHGTVRERAAAFLPMGVPDGVAGQVAADLAVAPAPAPAARTVFLVDDGSRTGQAVTAAFAAELVRRSGVIAGRRSIASLDPTAVQSVVSAVIEAAPDLVFYAGGTAAGADLRRTLSQTGSPRLRILTAGSIADNPGWAAAVGGRAISANTIGILPAPVLSTLPRARQFLSAFRRAFPGQTPLPQTAMAYDAAMDEIGAMNALIHAGKPVTSPALSVVVAASRYPGITGSLAPYRALSERLNRFTVYTCNLRGVWQYQSAVTRRSGAG